MIVSFGDPATEDFYHDRPTSRARPFPPAIVRAAIIKLDMINAAAAIQDLRSPPGNRVESLKGDLAALHSIRVNDQWRLIFRWDGRNAHDVRLVDYHS